MRKIIGWIVAACIMVTMVMASLIIHAKTNIRTENRQILEDSIKTTVSALLETKQYTVENADEFIADFLEGMLAKIESSSDVEVSILNADEEKGLISIEITETFAYPNGKTGKATCVKTVLFDQNPEEADAESENSSYIVTYYYDRSDLSEAGIFKQYHVKKGETLPKPETPVDDSEQKVFRAWKDLETNEEVTGDKAVKADISLYGNWNNR